jgi:hypothetical protein
VEIVGIVDGLRRYRPRLRIHVINQIVPRGQWGQEVFVWYNPSTIPRLSRRFTRGANLNSMIGWGVIPFRGGNFIHPNGQRISGNVVLRNER